MILWAEMDSENMGQVGRDEFEDKLDIDFARTKYAKTLAAMQVALGDMEIPNLVVVVLRLPYVKDRSAS